MIADASHNVVCYATLSMTAVDRSSSPKALSKIAPQQIPGLLIGRLATDTGAAGLGLGTEMVKHILATAVGLNIKAAHKGAVGLDPAHHRQRTAWAAGRRRRRAGRELPAGAG